LRAVNFQETLYQVEIILVDNDSEDATIERASAIAGDIKIVSIKKYVPGAALNLGVSLASGEFVVCVSAHCIPSNKFWLDNLVKPLQNDPSVACVYGRQLPLESSSPQDKRDLWLTFGLDDRIQLKDPFIHNANAAYRQADLVSYPFSEKMTNIEDRGVGRSSTISK
jgi:GT2 family glycosyltransferase